MLRTIFNYLEPLYRPPSEGNSLIFQVSLGCPNNTCHFCKMYKARKYHIRPLKEIKDEISYAGTHFSDTRRVFLADGDVMAMPYDMLCEILECLNKKFPQLTRVGVYANGSSLLRKSNHELKQLKELKLGICYMGLESGSQAILDDMNKKESVSDMIAAAERVNNIGIKLSVMILLGLGGKPQTHLHARATTEALNQMQPTFLSALTVTPEPKTRLFSRVEKGEFDILTTSESMSELKEIISGLSLSATVFRSNHVSNRFPLAGRFPRDKQHLLDEIDYILKAIQSLGIS
ncbi:MAG: radical SAM protein [Fibrobacteria bacterium]|nr:radical SAM protein [Fibrobacteria bacterium]